ncbi:MAG: trimethylamine methyltransferase family protein [Spirochaetota bacterium]|nr:MAG: trimethylamine methyltransferase family protein [Spirochaetota bacterium]
MKPPFFDILSNQEIIQIDSESKRILEESGVKVLHDECLNLLEEIGCKVDRTSQIVRIPSNVVQKVVEAIPSSFSLFGRDPAKRIELGGENVYFGPGGFAVFVEDLNTGKRRRAFRQDLIDHLKVSDALSGCEFNHVNVFPSDIPEKNADLYIWADALIYQTKPIMSENYNTRSVEALVEIGTILRGARKALIEKPFLCLDVCVLSPLTHDTRQVDLLLAGAKYGLPISINSGPIAGATSPVTLASVVSQANAEILSAIVITFAATPGTPVLYSSWGRHMDMRYCNVTMGGPEFALLKVCISQMGRYYGIPTRGGGALSDSLLVDTQAGYEKMLTTLIPAIGGLNYISGMGLNETENLQSLAQLVIDNEIVSMVKRILKGVEVDRDRLATELIIQRGPGSHFLDTDHTLRFFRQEFFYPEISNRMKYEPWSEGGALSARDRAQEKARKLLQNNPESELDSRVIKEIYEIVKREERTNKN